LAAKKGLCALFRFSPHLAALDPQRFNTTVQQLQALNPIITDPNNIQVGWVLTVPQT
jgi:hypothetical protein